jgi:hypothetical protein
VHVALVGDVEDELVVGELNTRCSAMVSSTTPRLGPTWPPLRAVTAMISSRISCASCGSWAGARALRSAGLRWHPAEREGGRSGVHLAGRGPALRRSARRQTCRRRRRPWLLELFDLELGLLEAGLADLEQLAALLEFGQQVGQGHVARFHRFDDGLEFGEGGFEGEFGFFGFHGAKMGAGGVYFKQSLDWRRDAGQTFACTGRA